MGKMQTTAKDARHTFSIKNGLNIARQLHVYLRTLYAKKIFGNWLE